MPGVLDAPFYTLHGFRPVATAEAQVLRRPLAGGDPVASARVTLRTDVQEGPPPPGGHTSPCRWCGVVLAAIVLCSSSAAVVLAYLQPHGRWQRFLPRLALPQDHLQGKSDSNKAFHLGPAGLSDVHAFQSIAFGACSDHGYKMITDFFSCRAAAASLQLLEAGFPITWDQREGCHFWSGQSTHRICMVPAAAATSAPASVAPTLAPRVAATDASRWPASDAYAGQSLRGRLDGPDADVATPEQELPADSGQVFSSETTPAFLPTDSPTAPPQVATTVVTTTTQQCGPMEVGFEYPGNDLYSVHAPSAETCCQVCAKEPRCLLWTWSGPAAEASKLCFLKGSEPRPMVTKVRNSHCISGQGADGQGALEVKAARPGQSLFCFSLVLPVGYERSLLALQYRHRASLFQCDEYAVYSNMSMDIAPGVTSEVVDSDLVVRKGGEFGTALNTDVFLTVWAKVIKEGRFLFHHWTVKLDPDAVFFASRLRNLILKHNETEKGTYLNNCKFGMHGPVEVFSRNAVKALGAGSDRCMEHFTKLCSGKCKWGEDMFIDQCLMRVLGVNREDDFHLLLEDHCDPPEGWSSCKDTTAVGFHPFKTEEGYRHCLANATR